MTSTTNSRRQLRRKWVQLRHAFSIRQLDIWIRRMSDRKMHDTRLSFQQLIVSSSRPSPSLWGPWCQECFPWIWWLALGSLCGQHSKVVRSSRSQQCLCCRFSRGLQLGRSCVWLGPSLLLECKVSCVKPTPTFYLPWLFINFGMFAIQYCKETDRNRWIRILRHFYCFKMAFGRENYIIGINCFLILLYISESRTLKDSSHKTYGIFIIFQGNVTD